MVEFLSLSKKAFGLEITDANIRIMKLAWRKGSLSVVSAGVLELEGGIVKDGVIQEEEKLAAAISRLVVNAWGQKIKTRNVVVSLPENKAFLQAIVMPKLNDQDLRAAVVFESENYIPLPLEKVYLDFEIIPPADNSLPQPRCEVLVAALPKEIVDSYLRTLYRAGLVPVAMEPESLALTRFLLQEKKLKLPTIIIQIGDAKTNLIIYSQNSVRFSFSIPISDCYFIEMIMKNTESSADQAERLKVECGIENFAARTDDVDSKTGPRDKKGKIFEALIPGLVDFVQQIQKCIQYYQSHEENGAESYKKNFDKVLICGSGSNLKGLDEFLALKLGMPIEKFQTSLDIGRIASKTKGFEKQNPCAYAAVAGLAARAVESVPASNQENKNKSAPTIASQKKTNNRRLKIKTK